MILKCLVSFIISIYNFYDFLENSLRNRMVKMYIHIYNEILSRYLKQEEN